MTRKQRIDRLVKLGMLAALSLMLMLVRFPMFMPFLEYDMADIPILIGTFLFGPWWGLLLTAAVCILQGVTVSAGSGFIGILMHFFATGAFVLVAGTIYQKHHNIKGAIIALIVGSTVRVLLMIPLNLLFTGYFMGTPIETVKALLLPAIIPFNAVKSFGNSFLTFLVYKSAGRILKIELIK